MVAHADAENMEVEVGITRNAVRTAIVDAGMGFMADETVLAPGSRCASPAARTRASVTGRPATVVVADDHAMFRESVAEMLSLDPAIEVVGQAENGAEAVARDEGSKVRLSLPRETLERVERGPEGKLTDRELGVLVLAARGESNAGIAKILNLAEGTVKRHLHTIYIKLEVGSRAEAISRALSEGWIGRRPV